ncbi:hypothetical protein JCM6882_003124 [Rhodosporidiobolus microsporus]
MSDPPRQHLLHPHHHHPHQHHAKKTSDPLLPSPSTQSSPPPSSSWRLPPLRALPTHILHLPSTLLRLLLALSPVNKLVLLTLALFLLKVLPVPYLTPPILLPHPIPSLIRRAELAHQARLAAAPKTLEEAYALYVRKRGRRPPRGWDGWYQFAVANGACRTADGFDELYSSLEVWWGVTGGEIRARMEAMGGRDANALGRVRVREGRVVGWEEMEEQGVGRGMDNMGESYARRAWVGMMQGLIDEGVKLPDVDFFVSQLDEPRVIIPYELRTSLEQRAKKRNPRPLQTEPLVFHDINAPSAPPSYSTIRRACPPSSAARQSPLHPHPGEAPHVSQRYTSAFTTSPSTGSFLSDPVLERRSWCDQPDLQQLHQLFVRPLSFSWTEQLFPVFSNSKVEGFNDILVPPWYHWFEKMPYREEEDVEWKGKANQLYWRGTNTGGRSIGLNWFGWMRSRLVSKVNRLIEWGHYETVLLPQPPSPHSGNKTTFLPAVLPSTALNSALTDIAFQAPDHHGDPSSLASQRTEPSFRFVTPEGHYTPFPTNYLYKATLDLDGTAYSGRLPALMASRSAVVRSNLFFSTLDDALEPWFHYLPLSVRFSELYHLLAYFFGASSSLPHASAQGFPTPGKATLAAVRTSAPHEDELYRVAERGREWAQRCARPREDSLVYAYLLVVEWARICKEEGREEGRWDLVL